MMGKLELLCYRFVCIPSRKIGLHSDFFSPLKQKCKRCTVCHFWLHQFCSWCGTARLSQSAAHCGKRHAIKLQQSRNNNFNLTVNRPVPIACHSRCVRHIPQSVVAWAVPSCSGGMMTVTAPICHVQQWCVSLLFAFCAMNTWSFAFSFHTRHLGRRADNQLVVCFPSFPCAVHISAKFGIFRSVDVI